jgi:hypothetical protein
LRLLIQVEHLPAAQVRAAIMCRTPPVRRQLARSLAGCPAARDDREAKRAERYGSLSPESTGGMIGLARSSVTSTSAAEPDHSIAMQPDLTGNPIAA